MSASQDMKQLRILSGAHAGAFLDLSPGTHTLGRADDCDITLTDWSLEALALRIGADGVVTAQWSGAQPRGLRMDDLAPVDFGGLVACIGPCDAVWPPDAQLLAALRSSAAPGPFVTLRSSAIASRRGIASGFAAVMVAAIGLVWLASASSSPRDDGKGTLASTRVALQQQLDALAPNRLAVSSTAGALSVDGLVDTPEQARAVTIAMDAVPPRFPLMRHVSVATDVAESIRGALGLPGAQVSYRGARVFSVAVESADVAATQAAINRVAVDLSPLVRHIDAVLQETPEARVSMPAMLSTLTADGVSVMETRDHVKHLVITNVAADAADPILIAPAAGHAAASIPSGALAIQSGATP
jgi:type III secretion protein D